MCDVITPIAMIVGAGTAVASAAAQADAAGDQRAYQGSLGRAQRKTFEQTVKSVKEDVGLQVDSLFAQRAQQIDAQRQELQNITRDSRLASAGYRAGTAEAGIMGKTVDQVHNQFEREVLEYQSAAARNITNMTVQVNREAQAIYSRGQSIINQGYPSPLPPAASVNMGLIAMQGITTGLNTYVGLSSAFRNPNPGSLPSGGTTGGTSSGYGSLGNYPPLNMGWPGQ